MIDYAELESIEITASVNWMVRLVDDPTVQPAQKRAAVLAYRRSSLRLLRAAEMLVDELLMEKAE